jgi:CheY-like chemotaxis protein
MRRDYPQPAIRGPELPPYSGPEQHSSFPPAPLYSESGNSETVLVVDDDRDLLAAASLRLQRAGFCTRCAYDGVEGVESARRAAPDAIVLDIRMPRMDGLTALRILRESPETMHIPVVVLSASLVDQQTALDAGARFFLRKPHKGTMLINAVERAIHEAD